MAEKDRDYALIAGGFILLLLIIGLVATICLLRHNYQPEPTQTNKQTPQNIQITVQEQPSSSKKTNQQKETKTIIEKNAPATQNATPSKEATTGSNNQAQNTTKQPPSTPQANSGKKEAQNSQ